MYDKEQLPTTRAHPLWRFDFFINGRQWRGKYWDMEFFFEWNSGAQYWRSTTRKYSDERCNKDILKCFSRLALSAKRMPQSWRNRPILVSMISLSVEWICAFIYFPEIVIAVHATVQCASRDVSHFSFTSWCVNSYTRRRPLIMGAPNTPHITGKRVLITIWHTELGSRCWPARCKSSSLMHCCRTCCSCYPHLLCTPFTPRRRKREIGRHTQAGVHYFCVRGPFVVGGPATVVREY